MVDSNKRTELFGQIFYFNHRSTLVVFLTVRQPIRTKYIGKTLQNNVWSIDAPHLSFADKSNAVALPCLVDDRGRNNNGNALLAQTSEHVPQLAT